MKHYVLGFVFSRNHDKVLLIRKERPSWQAGLWNGIGGKIDEKDLDPLEAMQRETTEEIGYEYNWKHCITFVCSGGTVFVYKAISNYASNDFSSSEGTILYQQIEDEKLGVWRLDSMPDKRDRELDWIIPVLLSDIQFPICVNLKDIEEHTAKSSEVECRLCKGTGKPCDSCGEYHQPPVMCPPHEVRMKWAKNICPECGREEPKKEVVK